MKSFHYHYILNYLYITFALRYRTPLWGCSGHLQTLAYGLWGRFTQPLTVDGERGCVIASDGTTVLYDVFHPPGGPSNAPILLLVPG